MFSVDVNNELAEADRVVAGSFQHVSLARPGQNMPGLARSC